MTVTALGTLGAVVPAGTGHAAPSAQLVYIANMGDNTVTAYDPETGEVAATIPVGVKPEGVALSPDGTKVLVTNNGGASLSMIDTTSNTVVTTVPVGQSPLPVAFSPDGRLAYVGYASYASPGKVDVIDMSTLTVAASVGVGAYVDTIALTSDGKRAYVASFAGNSVSVVDTAGNTVTATVRPSGGPQSPSGLAVTPDGKHVYVGHYNGSGTRRVSVIDTATDTVTADLPITNQPQGMAVTPDGRFLYVASTGAHTVTVVDTATNTIIATVPVGIRPIGLAIDPAGTAVYVSNNNSKNVSVIDTATNTVTATVPTGSGPYGIAIGKPVPPAVTGISPDHGPAAGGTSVTISGSHLTGTSAVSFGGTPASDVKVVDRGTVTATVPAHAAGVVDVALTVSGRTVAAGKYTYDAPAPVVTAVAPDHGPLAGGTTVTVTGSNLSGASAVTFGTVPATAVTVESDTRITATAPAGSAVGKVDVTVTTPGGTSAAQSYTYQDPAVTGAYVFAKSSDPKSGSTVKTGDKVTYGVTVTQQGADEVKGATITDDLSKVLDDATYGGDVKATSGTAEVKDGKLTWTGDLPVGGTATVTYSVTVTGSGDGKLHSAVTTTDDKRGRCDTEKGCESDLTGPAGSTPSPTPSPTPTGDGQAPGATDPGSTGGTGSGQSNQGQSNPGRSTAEDSSARQSSGILAHTGATVFTAAAISGLLLLLGGVTIAVSRRRGHQG
ncbi:IPT/TIG domain-containing protein [Kitasatospora sp. NPDC048286]|uniref:IPT/TIG domain-containing protein n=1 Tax=Kitasatospora sp. NPDC048286 TaxID=3364047 RepID=UPI0037218B91